MSSIDVISMALKNLFKRKLRTCLTILGVVIGTASIVVMISLGIALKQNFNSQLNQLSDLTLIHVTGVDTSNQTAKKVKMDDNAVATFKTIKYVEGVSPIINMYSGLKAVSGKFSANLNITGIDAKFLELLGYELETGRLLTPDDKLDIVCGGRVPFDFRKPSRHFYFTDDIKDKKPKVDVMKDKITASVDYNYGERNSEGNTATSSFKPYKINFVGVIKLADNGSYNEYDYNCYMTLEQVKKIQADKAKFEKTSGSHSGGVSYGMYGMMQDNKDGYSQIYIKCSDLDNVKFVADELKDMGYIAYYQGQYLEQMKATASNMQALLGAIGAVSLFVAAIGIANTMIMSVYERTREIGIMKVIGGSIKDIKKLFLLEAALIGFCGGILGVGFSLGISYLLNTTNISFFSTDMFMYGSEGVKPAVSVIPLWLCFLAVAFSGIVGLVSGYFPARRATKLSALTAIKSE